jgi:hypothetical protein
MALHTDTAIYKATYDLPPAKRRKAQKELREERAKASA